MKKTSVIKVEAQTVSNKSVVEEYLLGSGIVISLNESPRDLRKKEAGKPLYLTRYE